MTTRSELIDSVLTDIAATRTKVAKLLLCQQRYPHLYHEIEMDLVCAKARIRGSAKALRDLDYADGCCVRPA